MDVVRLAGIGEDRRAADALPHARSYDHSMRKLEPCFPTLQTCPTGMRFSGIMRSTAARPRRPDFPPPAVPLSAFNWKAVAFGIFADVFSTGAMSMLLYALLGARLVGEGAAPEAIEQTLLTSDAYVLIALAGGLACTVFGGYVAARVAGRLEYFHGLLTGIGVLVFSELMMLGSPVDYSVALRVLGDVLLVPAALYGAHLRKRVRKGPS